MTNSKTLYLLFLLVPFACFQVAIPGDPGILSDFVVPPNENVNNLDGTFFTYSGLRNLLASKPPVNFTIVKASMAEFPALNGQSVSYAALMYPPGGVNPPHSHPRAAELMFLLTGTLEVGFVDTTNKLYTQKLQRGDIFVFPKGLVQYQYNSDPKHPASAISAFGSASAGTVAVASTVFGTGIEDAVLAKAFKTNGNTVEKIKAGFPHKT